METTTELDVKTAAPSSDAAATPASPAPDVVPAGSSDQHDANKGGEKAPGTLADAVAAAVKPEPDSQAGDEAKKEDEGLVQELDKTDAAKEEPVPEDKGPIPYERFQEVVKEKNDFKTQYEQAQPLVAAQQGIVQFCQQNAIAPEQFQQALELAALMNNNPQEALKRLTPVIEQLRGFDGDTLPADLKADVEAGDITEARAKELAKLRAQTRMGERASRVTAEQQQQQTLSAINTAVTSWESSKVATDPDYKPKSAEADPDGKYEMVRDKLVAMLQQTQVRTPQDITTLAEKAYQAVNASLARFVPARPVRRALSSNGSSVTRPKEPATLAEVVQQAASRSSGVN